MSGDLPGIHSNEGKDVFVCICVCEVGVGGGGSSLLWISGMVHTGQMPGEQDKQENMKLK